MGLFDKFRKSKEQENIKPQKKELPFEVEFHTTENGLLQVDFYDKNADFRQLYDTTRLVVNPRPLESYGNNNVLNCKVSWYGREDAERLDNVGREVGRRAEYRGVLAQIDLYSLQHDPDYCYTVMKGLLDKKRVEQYLDRGLEENPEVPCGKYIGGVKQKENAYGKVFDTDIGRQSHYSNLMVNRRIEHRQQQEMRKQEQIESKRREIQKLQGELDYLRG